MTYSAAYMILAYFTGSFPDDTGIKKLPKMNLNKIFKTVSNEGISR